MESLRGRYGLVMALASITSSHLTCCFHPTTWFCVPVLFAKVLGFCQTLCTPGTVFKSFSAAADISSGLQLKAQVLSYFIVGAAEIQTAGRGQDRTGNFTEICWLVQSILGEVYLSRNYLCTVGSLSCAPVTINHINMHMPNIFFVVSGGGNTKETCG